jgi:tetratricopeptide (TPR) repeat protein
MNKFITVFLLVITMLIIFFRISYSRHQKYLENEKLNRLYREGLKINFDKNNDFCPEAEFAFCDSMRQLPANSPDQVNVAEYFMALNLLKLGKEQKAIDMLELLVKKTKTDEPGELYKNIRRFLGLAYLRLGERNNCISNHSTESCIFPIQGRGIYPDPFITQKGIECYKEILSHDSSDMESRWLINIAYMTIGQYPEKVPARWLIPGLAEDQNTYQVKAFNNIAGTLQLDKTRNMGGGVIIDDFNNDGYLDIITSSWGLEDSMHYYRNNKNGTFTDVSEVSGISKIKGGLNIIQADYNNDGYTDIFVLRGAWLREFGRQPCTLLRNNGDGTFTDVTVSSGLLTFGPTQTAVWGDFNNDGWLDLFVGKETVSNDYPHPTELFINNHDGTFSNVAAKAGCELMAYVKGVSSADYNKDGWPDIFISSLDGRKILLKNKGVNSRIPQFEDASAEAGLDIDLSHTFPTWFWDFDNDGWPDIFISGYEFAGSQAKVAAAQALGRQVATGDKMFLYRNNHNGTFSDISKETGLDIPPFAMGSNFGDFDNDGWLDFYLGTGNPDFRSLVPDRLFKNIEGRKFVDVTVPAKVGNLQKGHGISFADIDNDGDQDIFIETGGAYVGDAYFNSFYMNPGQNNNHWITIHLEGVQSNRSAIGVHIELSFMEDGRKRTVYRDVNSGGSFGSSPLRKEIGIGKAPIIDDLVIKWPRTGMTQDFKNVIPNQFIKIKEGVNRIEKENIKTLKFIDQRSHVNMIDCAPVSNNSLIHNAPLRQ